MGSWSLDRISLDQNTRSKLSFKFGTRSKKNFSLDQIFFIIFGTRSKLLLIIFTRSKVFKSQKYHY
jgi:hypothetical protein